MEAESLLLQKEILEEEANLQKKTEEKNRSDLLLKLTTKTAVQDAAPTINLVEHEEMDIPSVSIETTERGPHNSEISADLPEIFDDVDENEEMPDPIRSLSEDAANLSLEDSDELEPFLIDTLHYPTKTTFGSFIQQHTEKHPQKVKFPDTLEPKHGAMYIFDLQNNTLKDLNKLDNLKWKCETSGGMNKPTDNVKGYKYIGKKEGGIRDNSRYKYVFFDVEKQKALVHYFKMNDEVITLDVERVEVPGEVNISEEIENPRDKEGDVKAKVHQISNMKLMKVQQLDKLFGDVKERPEMFNINDNTKFIENPKRGELLIFDISKRQGTWEKELNADSYRWKRQKGRVDIGEKYTKQRFNAVTYNEEKECYENSKEIMKDFISDYQNTTAVVHYIGPTDMIKRGPHLNSSDGQTFVPNSPLTQKKIQSFGLSKTVVQTF